MTRHYSTLNISETVQEREQLQMNTNTDLHSALFNGIISNNLEWVTGDNPVETTPPGDTLYRKYP